MTGQLQTVLTVLVAVILAAAVYLALGGAALRMRKSREEASPRFLHERVHELLPWERRRSLEELSSLCHATAELSHLGGGMYHARGTMQSCTQRGQALLAYTVNSQRRAGTVTVRTSASEVVVSVEAVAGLSATVVADGRSLGTVRMATSEVLDPQGRRLGRVGRGKTIVTYGSTDYRDVELNGRRLAEINSCLLHRGQRLGDPPPAFRLHAPDISPDEERWLLALLALQLYTDRNRLTI